MNPIVRCFGAAFLLVAVVGRPGIFARENVPITNLGVTVGEFLVSDHHVVFVRSGSLHVYDLEAQTTTDLSSPVSRLPEAQQISGKWLAAWSEESEGDDLNGDGDFRDSVLHLFDLETGDGTNVGLAPWPGCCPGSFASGNRFVFYVYERAQGEEDLNGDGDVDDTFLAVYDPWSGTTTHTEIACAFFPQTTESWIVFPSCEYCPERDLNGDGDTRDCVFHVHNLGTRTTTNLELAGHDAAFVRVGHVSGHWLVFSVSESDQGGQDFNGDGDATDYVPHVYDLASGALQRVNFEFEVTHSHSSDLVASSGQWLVFQEQDTRILHVYDLETDLTRNLQLAACPRTAVASGEWLAFLAGDDCVLHVHNLATSSTTDLELPPMNETGSGRQYAIAGDRLVFAADGVLHVADLAPLRESSFQRGDTNSDGRLDVADVLASIDALLPGFVLLPSSGRGAVCSDAADANDDGIHNLSDVVQLASFVFGGGIPPQAPFPECGPDPTMDELTCGSFEGCR